MWPSTQMRHLWIANALKAPPPSDQAPSLTEARKRMLELRRKAQSEEIHMLDQELLSQGVRVELLRAQQEWTAEAVSNVRARVHLLQELVNQRRLAEAEKAKAEAALMGISLKEFIIRAMTEYLKKKKGG